MTLDNLLLELNTFTEIELLYEDFYNSLSDNNKLEQFRKTLDLTFIEANGLAFPEFNIYPEASGYKIPEYYGFSSSEHNNIQVLKHPCYSPAVEHSHDFFELIYVYRGSCTNTIYSSKTVLKEGDLILIPPDIPHTISVMNDDIIINILIKHSTFDDIFFNFLRIENVLSTFFLKTIYSENVNHYIIFRTNKDIDIKNILMTMFLEIKNKDRYYEDILDNLIIFFFSLLLRRYESTCELPTFIKKSDVVTYGIISFIQNNYQTVTLEDVAKKFNYNKDYISKIIKNTTGVSFTIFLKNIRMDRAKLLLIDTNISIEEISTNIGYNNVEHFIRTFKATFGTTPSSYRKQVR